MEDKLAQYLHQKCGREKKIKVREGILVVGKDILYTGSSVESEKIKYVDNETKDTFDTFDELLKHANKQLK